MDMYLKDKVDETGNPLKIVHEQVNHRWEVCLTMSEKGFQQISFVNSIATSKVISFISYLELKVIFFLMCECTCVYMHSFWVFFPFVVDSWGSPTHFTVLRHLFVVLSPFYLCGLLEFVSSVVVLVILNKRATKSGFSFDIKFIGRGQ